MSVKRQLPPVPKSGDQQTKSWMSAVTEIIRDLQTQSTLQAHTITKAATATVDVTGLGISKATLGLGNVDNTSDKKKPISDQTAQALAAKLDKAEFERFKSEQYAVGEWDVATDTDEDIGAQPGEVFKITEAGTYAGKALFVGDYVEFYEDDAGDLDVIVYVDPDRKADKTTNLTAGDGLTGGGTLASDRTFNLGTPGSISSSTTNTVSADSHTHELATSGVTPGTYTKLTVDSKGIVTAGTTLSAADIPALDWSKIATGKPTSLSGYGITDGVNISEVVTVATPGKILKLDVNSKLPADITGNSATTTKLATPRTITLSGDATGSTSFDGSANVSIAVTVAAGKTQSYGNAFQVGTPVSGVYYDNSINASVVANNTFGAGIPITIPVVFREDLTISEIGINVATAAASSSITIGVYDSHPTHGYPHMLQWSTTAFNTTTTGYKGYTVSPTKTFLKNTLYWIKFLPVAAPVISGHSTGNCLTFGAGYDSVLSMYPTNNKANCFSNNGGLTNYFIFNFGDSGSTVSTLGYTYFLWRNIIPQVIFKCA